MSGKSLEYVSVHPDEGEASLLEILPTWIGEHVRVIPPELFNLHEEEIKRRLPAYSPTTERLRIAFWMEHARAIQRKTVMHMPNVYGGLVGFGWFKNKFVANTFNLLYMLTPPMAYEVAVEECLLVLTEQIRQIALLPPVDSQGNVDNKLVASKVALWKELSDRSRGKVINRTQIQSKNVTVEVTKDDYDELAAKSVAEIEAEIQLIESGKTDVIGLVLDEEEKALVGSES